MFYYSKKSLDFLASCHPDIRVIFSEAIKHYDIAVLCGYRGKEEQSDAFARKASSVKWPKSRHNRMPSEGIDFAPFPIKWTDKEKPRFVFLAGFLVGLSQRLKAEGKIKRALVWGGDWDGDLDLCDQTLYDLGHAQLEGK